jgi:hypothetical protein
MLDLLSAMKADAARIRDRLGEEWSDETKAPRRHYDRSVTPEERRAMLYEITGEAWHPQRTILSIYRARHGRIAERTVRSCLDWLVDAGKLERRIVKNHRWRQLQYRRPRP